MLTHTHTQALFQQTLSIQRLFYTLASFLLLRQSDGPWSVIISAWNKTFIQHLWMFVWQEMVWRCFHCRYLRLEGGLPCSPATGPKLHIWSCEEACFFFSLISHYLFLCHLWFQGGPLHYFVSLQFQVKSPKLKKANQEIYFEQRLRSFSWIWATQRPSELKLHVNKTQFKVKISDILFLIMYWLHGSYHKN